MEEKEPNTIFGLSEERVRNHVETLLNLKGKELNEYNEKLYDDFADTYDQAADSVGAQGAIVAPVVLEEYMKDSKEGRILDVAAGTGRAGAVLHKLGFSNIDALDVSKMMLEKAKEKNVYNQLIQASIDGTPIPEIPPDSYDAIICTHAFSPNQLLPESLYEFIRIVKSKGWLCFTAMKNYVSLKEYDFLNKISDLVIERKIDLIFMKEFQYHEFNETAGLTLNENHALGYIFVCKVL